VPEQTPERFSYSKREELSWLASGFLPMRNTQLTRKMPITANMIIPNPTSLIIVPPNSDALQHSGLILGRWQFWDSRAAP
jgi:hypothetical protein